MLVELGQFALGLLLLVLGADSFVRGASGLAIRFGISPFVVGLVLVGLGTSAPELSVNLTAAFAGRYEIAIGNVVGSNIANIGLILGVSALIAPLAVNARLIRIEVPLLIAVSVGLWLLSLDGLIGRIDAVILLIGLAGLLVLIARDSKLESTQVQDELTEAASTQTGLKLNLIRLVAGLALLLYGSQQMVDAAVKLATLWGMSELLIGLTIVAIGTSLPELAASAMAAWRGHSDIALGNVVGSNLFNILLILGATAAIHPLSVGHSSLRIDLPLMIGFALLLYPIVRSGRVVSRNEAMLLLLAYAGFLALQFFLAAG
ncbi:MAG: calcium/sodium antiporter [Xanthomonadaceae bacterium]|nr:calcium/sodium antiporter [Xanthomonadaceae bacterium]MDZ4116937.1 calcium/sodium antiporter [Xanthomonadaceae bacterium]